MKKIINVAVIAHVDAGKSTLVDGLLDQSGTFDERFQRVEQIMDSNDQERERGITIYSKNCSVQYKDTKINIVDTPGHADFSGEVERIMSVVDTVILLVDSSEGPMPQTRFVLKKSLEAGLKPILLINKIDKPDQRAMEVVDMTLELFLELGADDEQLEFPILFGSAKNGFVQKDMETPSDNLSPLFDALIEHVPAYPHGPEENLQMQITSLKYDNFLGRIGVGRVKKGTLKNKGRYSLIDNDGNVRNVGFSKVFVSRGLEREEVSEVQPGDICMVAGISDITIGDTISSVENPEKMPNIDIEEPTITMNFLVNKSPFSGREGKFVTSRNIGERLEKELETNVALRYGPVEGEEGFKVDGRGELHLSVLIESMRREGFELAVSKPKVLLKTINGEKQEPYEEALVTCADEFAGAVIQQLSERKGLMSHMDTRDGQTTLKFDIPTRGLIGYRQEFLTTTRGTGILEKTFTQYGPFVGQIKGRKNGVLVSNGTGSTMGYSLWKLSDRGNMIVGAAQDVYEGQIVGIHNRENDLDVNPLKNKQLTNVRSSGNDEAIRVQKPIVFTLEEAIEFIEPDELVEVTPKSIRLRKRVLDKRYRKKQQFI